MADQLNMGGLSLGESQHAASGGAPGRSTYIPPHMRGMPQPGPPPAGPPAAGPPGGPPRMDGPPPGGMGSSAWAATAPLVQDV